MPSVMSIIPTQEGLGDFLSRPSSCPPLASIICQADYGADIYPVYIFFSLPLFLDPSAEPLPSISSDWTCLTFIIRILMYSILALESASICCASASSFLSRVGPLLYCWIMFSAPCFTFNSMFSCFSNDWIRCSDREHSSGRGTATSPGDIGVSEFKKKRKGKINNQHPSAIKKKELNDRPIEDRAATHYCPYMARPASNQANQVQPKLVFSPTSSAFK